MLLYFGSSVRPRQEFQEERIPAKFRKDGEFLVTILIRILHTLQSVDIQSHDCTIVCGGVCEEVFRNNLVIFAATSVMLVSCICALCLSHSVPLSHSVSLLL